MLQLETLGDELVGTVESQVLLTVISQADELSGHAGLVQARIAKCKTDGVVGELALAAAGPDGVLKPGDLSSDHAGKIVVADGLIGRAAFDRAAEIGVAALVCGGFHDSDLRDLLGYDLGVAITGHEDIRPILIITEGFGDIAMAERTFSIDPHAPDIQEALLRRHFDRKHGPGAYYGQPGDEG